MKNSFSLLSSLSDDHVTFEDVVGDDWTDPVTVLLLSRSFGTCIGDHRRPVVRLKTTPKLGRSKQKQKQKFSARAGKKTFNLDLSGFFYIFKISGA